MSVRPILAWPDVRLSTNCDPVPNGEDLNLLIADMDSTMIGEECVDELAAEAGVYDHVAAITKRAMNGGIDPLQRAESRNITMLES